MPWATRWQSSIAADAIEVSRRSQNNSAAGGEIVTSASNYQIAAARPTDVPLLPAIELVAARLYAGYAPDTALVETISAEAHAEAQREGHL